MKSTTATSVPRDERGWFVLVGGSPYVAYAVHGGPAYLTRATSNPDGSITLNPVGGPHARLDLAVDADREAYAATAEYECARCGTPLKRVGSAWVSIDYLSTGGGLSFCPPDPDAAHTRDHRPREAEGLQTSLAAAEQKLIHMRRTATNLGLPILPMPKPRRSTR